MVLPGFLLPVCALGPAAMMLISALAPRLWPADDRKLWKRFTILSTAALLAALGAAVVQWVLPAAPSDAGSMQPLNWLAASRLSALVAVLVQLLGTIIGVFSSRYLQGEPGQARYIAALAGVLASVHLLLLADHWLVLIVAWSAVGAALQRLLCFYQDRPFALLAAHKKRIADRLADFLLIVAAILAWRETGSGSFSGLWQYVGQYMAQGGDSIALQTSAVCLVLAVILRTALFPVHGWLIQVMEAPTPVSALLHAGVVNLGGYVLIRFAPLLEHAPAARWVLVGFGLGTALLAGLVMLTRISIKVRLAWSTVAQMGFMLLECGLGLYTLALLHLIGHSLYKAHSFLSASTAVEDTKRKLMRGAATYSPFSMKAAPLIVAPIIALVQVGMAQGAWPWWWTGVLALAWAPMLWLPARRSDASSAAAQTVGSSALMGLAMVTGLSAVACFAHVLPFGIHDSPFHLAGIVSLLGMAVMYLCLVRLQLHPQGLAAWRRWGYAGFYVDEFYTRLALRLWPTRWVPAIHISHGHAIGGATAAVASK
ncbi:MAG TPA: NADH-quinone oxidoreductase subunit L [Noviherbaspirillum sp.]